jgi:hypothetical protein
MARRGRPRRLRVHAHELDLARADLGDRDVDRVVRPDLDEPRRAGHELPDALLEERRQLEPAADLGVQLVDDADLLFHGFRAPGGTSIGRG